MERAIGHAPSGAPAAGRLHWPAVSAGLLLSALVFPLLLFVFVAWDGGFTVDREQALQAMVLFAVIVLVTGLHALLIGLPLFLWLRRVGWLSVGSVSVAGFFAGGLLVGIAGWPLRGAAAGSSYATTWHGSFVEMQKDGIPTLYGWLSWIEGTTLFGLAGVASALAFWYGWRYFQHRAKGPGGEAASPPGDRARQVLDR